MGQYGAYHRMAKDSWIGHMTYFIWRSTERYYAKNIYSLSNFHDSRLTYVINMKNNTKFYKVIIATNHFSKYGRSEDFEFWWPSGQFKKYVTGLPPIFDPHPPLSPFSLTPSPLSTTQIVTFWPEISWEIYGPVSNWTHTNAKVTQQCNRKAD